MHQSPTPTSGSVTSARLTLELPPELPLLAEAALPQLPLRPHPLPPRRNMVNVVEPVTLDLQLALRDRLAHTPTPTILSACKPNMEVGLKLVYNRSTQCINCSDTQH
ncbi:hypothetical protein H0H93_013676 [Arthromyces matolae]|nr:hypothetical protein H0H93_013676 [Arthromyces matolae]